MGSERRARAAAADPRHRRRRRRRPARLHGRAGRARRRRRQPAGGRPRACLAPAAARCPVRPRRGGLGGLGRLLRAAAPSRRGARAQRRGRRARRARRSSTAWRRGSRSACSPSRPSARPSLCRPAAGASTPVGAARPGPPSTATVHGASTAWPAAASVHVTYAVQPGDTLWRIADELLGDGADWTSLAALNLGRDVGGGARFVDPDQLREGWRLRLPADGAPARRTMMRARRSHGGTGTPAGHLPELIALGLGSLACAALARRARQRRRLGDAVHAATRSGDRSCPRGRWTRRPCCTASRAFRRSSPSRPPIACWPLALDGRARPSRGPGRSASRTRASPSVFATAPHGRASCRPSSACEGRRRWHVGHAALEGHDPAFPYLPVVLPIGDDAEGTWLVPLEPGDVLPLLGEAAPALWRVGTGGCRVLGLVGDDPRDRGSRRRRTPRRGRGRSARGSAHPVLRRPGVAPSGRGRRAAPWSRWNRCAASDLTVLVDRQAATLHPMGQVVRPHLQSVETAAQIAELVAPLPE